MKKLFRNTVPIFYLIIIVLVIILSGAFGIYNIINDDKWAMLISGIISGLIAVIVTLCLSYYEFKKIERFRQLGVIDILPERTDKKYYEEIIRDAKTSIQVMGTSCTRFLEDFANQNRQDHVLIDAMNSNGSLNVQILVPDKDNMDDDSKKNFESQSVRHIIENLKEKYTNRLTIRRFNFRASNSLVRVDNHLIVGPVFPKVDSRHTPAIHLNTSSKYAKKYIQYYETVWNDSDD